MKSPRNSISGYNGWRLVRPRKTKTPSFDSLIKNVYAWFDEHDLHDPVMQMVKVQEEVGELAHEIARSNYDTPEVVDALGDSFVTLIGMCHHLNISPADALLLAYTEIKDRKGKTVNNSFVKDEGDFEERHGWAPDSDFEIIRCNKTPEEIEKIHEEWEKWFQTIMKGEKK